MVCIIYSAGLTYCAVASYILMNKEIDQIESLINWICKRITEIGINGRTGKVPDSCYTFWVYATLCNIKHDDLFNHEIAKEFVLNCQTAYVCLIK